MNCHHEFRFGLLQCYNEYAIITCNENEDIGFEEIKEIQAVLYPAYGRKKFGLIANREHHYSVDPLAIDELFSHENLVAGAIVSINRLAAYNAEVEDMYVQGAPIRYFPILKLAIPWITTVVNGSPSDFAQVV